MITLNASFALSNITPARPPQIIATSEISVIDVIVFAEQTELANVVATISLAIFLVTIVRVMLVLAIIGSVIAIVTTVSPVIVAFAKTTNKVSPEIVTLIFQTIGRIFAKRSQQTEILSIAVLKIPSQF